MCILLDFSACELHCILTACCPAFLFLCLVLLSLFLIPLLCFAPETCFPKSVVADNVLGSHFKHITLASFPSHRADPMQFPSYSHRPRWCLLTVLCLPYDLQLPSQPYRLWSFFSIAQLWPRCWLSLQFSFILAPLLFSSHSCSSVLPTLLPYCQLLPWL